MLRQLTTECNATLSINIRVPLGAANYDQLHSQHNSSMLRTDFTKFTLEVDTVTRWIFYIEAYKANSRRGCQASLSTFTSPTLLSAIKTTLVRQFPNYLGQFTDVPYDAIPEDLFVKFLLLRMSKIEETDKEDITNVFQKLRMPPGNFDYASYRSCVGHFLRLREMFRSHLT